MSHDAPAVPYEEAVATVGQIDFRRGRLIAAALTILGIGAFAFLLLTGHTKQAWQSYLVNLVFFLGLAQAGVVWAAVARTARGSRWASTLVRAAEALSAFLPIGYALVLIFLFAGGSQLYSWVEHPIPHKTPWLNWPFFVARNAILMGLLVLMSRRLLGLSLKPDLARLKDRVGGKLKDLYGKRAGGAAATETEDEKVRHTLNNLSPWFIYLYCITYTIWAFDVMMSLDPHWFANLFGAFVFMSTLYTGVAAIGVSTILMRKPLGLEQHISTEQYHTLGKLLFAFALFWVYSYWSHFLPIWYGNLAEETPFVVLRLEGPFRPVAWTVFALTFAIPFFGLMNWTTKRRPGLHLVFALICLAGVWLERNLIVLPSINPERFDLTLPQLGVMAGFLGAFTLAYLRFASRYPMLSSIGIKPGSPPEWSGGH